jgi:hypothetical protein
VHQLWLIGRDFHPVRATQYRQAWACDGENLQSASSLSASPFCHAFPPAMPSHLPGFRPLYGLPCPACRLICATPPLLCGTPRPASTAPCCPSAAS